MNNVPLFKDLLLAKPYDPDKHNINGWIASEKLDGVRAFYDGKFLWSRTKKIRNAPEFFFKKFT